MKLHAIILCFLLLQTIPIQAEETRRTMHPDAFAKRSYAPTLAHYILSRSTGRPYNPPPEPATSPAPAPEPVSAHAPSATPPPQPRSETPVAVLPTPSGLDPDIFDRIQKYDPLVKHYSRLNGIDPNLTRAVIYVESAGNMKAVSSQGARGLMQLMPDTASDMGVENAFDPAQNIFGGTRYLSHMINRFGSLDLALWAYNAGPESVKRKHLPRETRQYIPSVIRIKRLLERKEP